MIWLERLRCIELFGGPCVTDGDRGALLLPTRKSEALLAYLVAQDEQPVSCEFLCDLLWPYSGPEQARASLRQKTSVLHKALGPVGGDSIASHGDRLAFQTDAAQVDLWTFRAVDTGRADAGRLAAALALYKAPFLDAFRVRSQPFSDWVWSTRQELEAMSLSIGTAALTLWDPGRHPEKRAETARHLCRIEPTHRALIQLYLERGAVELARRQMRECTEALKTHLDAEPAEETRRLAAGIDRDRSQISVADAPSAQRRDLTVLSIQAEVHSEDPGNFARAADTLTEIARTCAAPRGGSLGQVQNDRLLVAFGYPGAHDRQADIALDVALDVVAAGSGCHGGSLWYRSRVPTALCGCRVRSCGMPKGLVRRRPPRMF
ncbi:MAG: hypothetical protein OIF48_05105 [Silicimonas sp.]|nr:hypothetical protein [Silicimonas sp.]